MKLNRINRSGFTLVEILVVATIIGLLAAIGVTGYSAASKSGRDSKRKADLEMIRSALEIYKSGSAANSYPADNPACTPQGLAPGYIPSFPPDPKPASYKYCYEQWSATSYVICAHLENGGSGVPGACINNDCGGGVGVDCNYFVNNP